MRYQELLERDHSKIAAHLQAVIDHPTTDPIERAAAQARLGIVQQRIQAEKEAEEQKKAAKSFQPVEFPSASGMVYNKDGKMQTPGGKPKPFTPNKF